MRTNILPGVNRAYFVSIAFLLISWRLAPDAAASWPLWIIPLILVTAGTKRIIQTYKAASTVQGPQPFLLTPPIWFTIWVTIIVTSWAVGTPHLRVDSGPGGCLYVGWNGAVREQIWPCPTIKILALPASRALKIERSRHIS